MYRSIRHRLALFTYSWRTVGPATILRNSLRWAADVEARTVDRGFDDRHGTDTSAPLTPGEARIPGPRRGAATLYVPSADQDVDTLLDALPWPAGLREAATFVDVGSGKGRVVMLAAMRRFRRVVGVELSPVLHDAASRNLARVEAGGALHSPVELVLGDATTYAAPAGPVVLYLYHPFRAAIAAEVITRLVASLEAAPRPAAVLYGHPTLQPPYPPSLFRRDGVLALATEGARHTARFRIGWSVWTNTAWLARRARSTPTPAPAPAPAVEA